MHPVGSSPCFEKYEIDKTYTIRRTNFDGTTTIIDDPRERERILDADYLQGSIAFSRDERHVSIIHKLIYLFQKIVAWVSGTSKKVDPDYCHGMVILGKGKAGKKDKVHPWLVAHALFPGIQTSNWDFLQDKDVTNVVIYRPIDDTLRRIYKENAERTAFVDKKEYQTDLSPLRKHRFSLWDMAATIFHNRRHSVCGKHGPIPERMQRRTASIVADLLLGNQPLNDRGKLASFFCTSYAATILQGSFILRALEGVDEVAKQAFVSEKGSLLNREQLIQKIEHSFKKEDTSNAFAQRLWKVYTNHKLARMDIQFTMSAFAATQLDKLSIRRRRAEDPLIITA